MIELSLSLRDFVRKWIDARGPKEKEVGYAVAQFLPFKINFPFRKITANFNECNGLQKEKTVFVMD